MPINLSVGQLNALANSNPSQIRSYTAENWLEWGSNPAYLWHKLTGHVVRLIDAETFNAIAAANNTGAYRTVGRMTTSQFDDWIAYKSIAPGFSGGRHAFCRLTAHTINVIGSSQYGHPLRAAKLTVDLINSWFSTLASPNDLSARVFNELAANSNGLLSNLVIRRSDFNNWVNRDRSRFAELSAQALNALAVQRTARGSPDRPLFAAEVNADAMRRWMNGPRHGGNDFRALSATAIDTLAWSGPNGALLGMGSFEVMRDWFGVATTDLGRLIRLTSLGVITVNTLVQMDGFLGWGSLDDVMPTRDLWARSWLNHWRGAGRSFGEVHAAALNYLGVASEMTTQNWRDFAAGTAIGQTVRNSISQVSNRSFVAINLSTLNDIAQLDYSNSSGFFTGVRGGQWAAWLAHHGQAGFVGLSAHALNLLGAAEAQPLAHGTLGPSDLAAWLNQPFKQFLNLSPSVLNALAANAGQPLHSDAVSAWHWMMWLRRYGTENIDAQVLDSVPAFQWRSLEGRAQIRVWASQAGHDMGQLSPDTVASFEPALLDNLPPAALAQITGWQWSAWSCESPGRSLANLETAAAHIGVTGLNDLSDSAIAELSAGHWNAIWNNTSSGSLVNKIAELNAATLNRLPAELRNRFTKDHWAAWLQGEGNSLSQLSESVFAGIPATVLAQLMGQKLPVELLVLPGQWEALMTAQGLTAFTAADLNAIGRQSSVTVLGRIGADHWLGWFGNGSDIARQASQLPHFGQTFSAQQLQALAALSGGPAFIGQITADQWKSWLTVHTMGQLNVAVLRAIPASVLFNPEIFGHAQWSNWCAETGQSLADLRVAPTPSLGTVTVLQQMSVSFIRHLNDHLSTEDLSPSPLYGMRWADWEHWAEPAGNLWSDLSVATINEMGSRAGELTANADGSRGSLELRNWLAAPEGGVARRYLLSAAVLNSTTSIAQAMNDADWVTWSNQTGNSLSALGTAFMDRIALRTSQPSLHTPTLLQAAQAAQYSDAQWLRWLQQPHGSSTRGALASASIYALIPFTVLTDPAVANLTYWLAWSAARRPTGDNSGSYLGDMNGHMLHAIATSTWSRQGGAAQSLLTALYTEGTQQDKESLLRLLTGSGSSSSPSTGDAAAAGAARFSELSAATLNALFFALEASQVTPLIPQTHWQMWSSRQSFQELLPSVLAAWMTSGHLRALSSEAITRITPEQWSAWLWHPGRSLDALDSRVVNQLDARALERVTKDQWYLLLNRWSDEAQAQLSPDALRALGTVGLSLSHTASLYWLNNRTGTAFIDRALVSALDINASFALLNREISAAQLAAFDATRWGAWLEVRTDVHAGYTDAKILAAIVQAGDPALLVVLGQRWSNRNLNPTMASIFNLPAAVLDVDAPRLLGGNLANTNSFARWLRADIVNQLSAETLAQLLPDQTAWSRWAALQSAAGLPSWRGLDAHVFNAHAGAVALMASTTGTNPWTVWADETGHHFRQLTVSVINHIPVAIGLNFGSPQWAEVILRSGPDGLGQLSSARFTAELTTDVLEDWPEQWIGKLTLTQWRVWAHDRPRGFAHLSPSTVSAMAPGVVEQIGLLPGVFGVDPLRHLADSGRLDELSGQFLARLSGRALNELQHHTDQFTDAQWRSLQVALSTIDRIGDLATWGPLLNGRTDFVLRDLFRQASLASPSDGRPALLDWALELAQGPGCAHFLADFTELLREKTHTQKRDLLALLKQAPDAASAGALVTILRQLPVAYPGLTFGNLLAGVVSPGSAAAINAFVEALVPSTEDTALRAKLRASLDAFLARNPTPYQRLSWLGGHLLLSAAEQGLLDGQASESGRRQTARDLSDMLEVMNQGGDLSHRGVLDAIGFANAMWSTPQTSGKEQDVHSWANWAAFGKTGVLLASQFALSRLNNLMRDFNLDWHLPRSAPSGDGRSTVVPVPAALPVSGGGLENPIIRMAAVSEALGDIISVNRLLIMLAQVSQAQASFEDGRNVVAAGQVLQAVGSITNILATISLKADALMAAKPAEGEMRLGAWSAFGRGTVQLLGNAFSPVSWLVSTCSNIAPDDPTSKAWFAGYSPYVTKVFASFTKNRGSNLSSALRVVNVATHRTGSIMIMANLIHNSKGEENELLRAAAGSAIGFHAVVGLADMYDIFSSSTGPARVYVGGAVGFLGNVGTLVTNTYVAIQDIKGRYEDGDITEAEKNQLISDINSSFGVGVATTVLIPTLISFVAPWALSAAGASGPRLFNTVRTIGGLINVITLSSAVMSFVGWPWSKANAGAQATDLDPDALRAALHQARARGCLVDARLLEAALEGTAAPSGLNLRAGALQRLQAFQQNEQQIAALTQAWSERGPVGAADFQWLTITQFAAQFHGLNGLVGRMAGAAQLNTNMDTGWLSLQANPSDLADMTETAVDGLAWAGFRHANLEVLSPGAPNGSILIKPVLQTSGRPALVTVVDDGSGDGSWDSSAGDPQRLFIDARGLPDGSFVHIDPSLTNVSVIYRGGQTLTTSLHAQLVREPGSVGSANITLSGLDLSGRRTGGLTIDTDSLSSTEDMTYYGSQLNDTVSGTNDGLVYHYGGGQDRVNYRGSNGTISLGLGSTARLTGSNNVLQMVAADTGPSGSPGRWVSTGERNALDFSTNAGGLQFSWRGGHGEVRLSTSAWWSGQASDVTLASYRGFEVLRGTMGSDRFTISESLTSMRAEATPMAWHGGGGDDSYTITGSDGHQLSLGLGNNTVVLDSAVGTVVATARAEAGRAAGNNTITLQRGATLEAVLMGNSVITSDTRTAWDWASDDSWVRAKVSGGTHTIDLEGQASIISVDARRASNTTVENLVVTPGHTTAQDRATQLQQVLLGSNTGFSLYAGGIDSDNNGTIDRMDLVSVNTNGAVVARLRLTGNLDADMLVMWGELADDEGVDSTSQRRAYRGDHLIQAIATSGTATPTTGGGGVATIARDAGWTRYLNLATLTTPPLLAA